MVQRLENEQGFQRTRTNWLTPWSQFLPEKTTAALPPKKFLTLHQTWRLRIIFTRAPVVPINRQMNPGQTYLKYILILLSHICLKWPLQSQHSLSFMFSYSNRHVLSFALIYATIFANLTILNVIVVIICGEEYKLWCSSLCKYLTFLRSKYFP